MYYTPYDKKMSDYIELLLVLHLVVIVSFTFS